MMIDSCVASIESTFFDYLSKKINDAALCKRLSQALSAADLNGAHKTFTVSLIDGKSEYLGMCVYPDMTQLTRTIRETYDFKSRYYTYDDFCKAWFTNIDIYYIEIDKNVFDRRVINFTPQELTAMLLHELSHVVYSDKVSEKMYRSLRVHMVEYRKHDPGLTKLAIGTLYAVPAMIACCAHKANTGVRGMKEEYICDKVFGLKNYQEHLRTALDKIIKAYGTQFVLDDGTSDKKMEATMKWVDFNIDNIISRRDALGREIVNMAASTRSNYAKNVFLDITKKLGIGARDKYTGRLIAMESIIDGLYNGEIEINGFLTKYDLIDDIKAVSALEMAARCVPATEGSKGKLFAPKLPNAFDIDSISIEIDRVRTHSDRIYVLDLIHARLEEIANFEEYYGENSPEVKKLKPKIDLYKKTLDEQRASLLSKHNLDKTYKVFTKCPVGYEG